MNKNRELTWMFIVIIFFAFLVRGMVVEQNRDFWHDEAFQYQFSLAPTEYIMDSNDVHPPLFTMFTKFLIQDLHIKSIFGLRYFMVFISILFLVSLYYTTREIWDEWIALLTVFLASFTPTFVYYSTEFRSYIFTLLIVVWQIFFFNKMIGDDNDYKKWNIHIGFVLASTYMIYTHYMAGMILIVQAIYLLIFKKRWYILEWTIIGVFSIPLLIYLINTLPKIQSFWFKNIDLVSLISTFAYILSPPFSRSLLWVLLIYGILIMTYIKFRKNITELHLQYVMYLVLPIIIMWTISQFFPFYHHRYFLFGGMALFPLVSWGVMQWSKKVDKDAELGFIAIIILFALLTIPLFICETFNHEIFDSALFIYNETDNMTKDFVVIHTSPFSQTPYKVYLKGVPQYLYTNLTKQERFTAGGAVIRDFEVIDRIQNMNTTTFLVSDRIQGEVLWSEGGLNVCKIN